MKNYDAGGIKIKSIFGLTIGFLSIKLAHFKKLAFNISL